MCSLEIQPSLDLSRLQGRWSIQALQLCLLHGQPEKRCSIIKFRGTKLCISARRTAGKVGTPIVGRRAVGAHARLIRAGKRALPAFVRDERRAHPHLLLKGPPTMCTASRSYPRPPMWVVVRTSSTFVANIHLLFHSFVVIGH
jgi:ribosomal protein L39E